MSTKRVLCRECFFYLRNQVNQASHIPKQNSHSKMPIKMQSPTFTASISDQLPMDGSGIITQ